MSSTTIERKADWFPLEAPALYSTEEVEAADKQIYAHYFLRNSHWFIAEYDRETKIAFAYSILNDDFLNAEWGYISLVEISELRITQTVKIGDTTVMFPYEVERDTDWVVCKASEVPQILL